MKNEHTPTPCKYCGHIAVRETDEDCPDNPANKKPSLVSALDQCIDMMLRMGWPVSTNPELRKVYEQAKKARQP